MSQADWFQGLPDLPAPAGPIEVQSIDRSQFGPDKYDADPGLRDAVNTALLLGQPLLLTGEPGAGKTQLAEKLALELGMKLFKFETKSSSVAQELFYSFDHVARFQAAQAKTSDDDLHPRRFIDYGALGKAVVQSLKASDVDELLGDGQRPSWYAGQQRAVVLIDEIDKAPSDFPNDALNEIERYYFRIREWAGREVVAEPELRPVVVITSNSEKQLPDAFLRRCIFYHLPPVTRDRLLAITVNRLGGPSLRAGKLLDSALDLFEQLRNPQLLDLRKRPSTSEFLAFVTVLMADDNLRPDRPADADALLRALSVLVKAPEDQDAARRHVESLRSTAGRRP